MRDRQQTKLLNSYLQDAERLLKLPIAKKHLPLTLPEYPFDGKLLTLSSLYRHSRKAYLAMGGTFTPRVCSTMRSLSAQDIFKNDIEFSPVFSELKWFATHHQECADPTLIMKSLACFSEVSLFHEQNHRILWPLLPPPPEEQADVCRYLNFAESLVVTLDLALGDEIGAELSPKFERFKSLYRPSGRINWEHKSKQEYRGYLKALLFVTYLTLELIEPADIPKALTYVLAPPPELRKESVKRGQELSELFTLNTNRQWQHRYWKSAATSLRHIHRNSAQDPFYLCEDPLDFEEEFLIAERIFDHFGL